MSALNLSAQPFIPRRRQAQNSNGTAGSYEKSADGTTRSTVTNISSRNNSVGQPQFNSTPTQATPQQAQQALYKKLLYWEPKDANGSVLDEAYCIECIPSDFWQKPGDLSDTVKSFEKYFNTTLE
ncbi:hypothetical protein EIN_248820 [Entamoeba invadens IP1]|uniref:Uncharacterized protein n=1 Tax=Entamoeba invadens IP1 TaxID=370355 RepID=A0A0A1UEF5_ENTIV|nr:hypothetical protein EIN_248820 [Entamoeba invadens IP1]ELP94868.1 hypothetical protein EIN_248820 [Entamoeba invadens IP1]|eukprot:XP_004261639.1 hypothetical protein EIN_248820 [Entamoeba invadens IP1]